MASTKNSSSNLGRHQQEVLEGLQKTGTLGRKTVVHISEVYSDSYKVDSGGANGELKNKSPPTSRLEERTLVLSDGTQIIVESVNEFELIGPTGAKIVLSCLPLFSIPEHSLSKNHHHSQPTSFVASSLSPSKSRRNQKGGWVQFTSSVVVTTETSIEMSKSAPPLGENFLDPLPRLDDVFSKTAEDNVFNYLDPFSETPSDNVAITFEESARDKQFDEAFAEAKGGVVSSDEHDLTDSDDNFIDENPLPPLSVNYVDQLTPKARAASVSFMKVDPKSIAIAENGEKKEGIKSLTTPTILPPPPLTMLPRYETKAGWLVKLSHQKGVFGDKWQKRYFILNGSVLVYFKKYGDSQPRGSIKLIPGSWCQAITQGSPRMTDAVAKTDRAGVISVNRCLAVHRPNNFAASLSALLSSEGAVDAFSSLTVALTNPSDASRTFYMIAPSEQERHSWIDAISHNISAYSRSQEALDVACNELKSMLQAVGTAVVQDALPSILLSLHLKRDSVAKTQLEL